MSDREKVLEAALKDAQNAIAEYYRYWTGGETRGSYDGKPERANLWKAGHKARTALAAPPRDEEAERLRARVAELEAAATKAAQMFRHYEQLHAAKDTPDGRRKAAANADMALALERVVEGNGP